ncbi:hypothetical protein P3L10_018920 [Capsicum annuum]|uniref:uncharacterized protein LOC124899537 n=1 Tax=Capsicum annuum TaxID=4072 RepID=UPI001FB0665A|nr:uncharacterized protein LOC124899537 [Capsicum annuum]
MKKVSNTLSNSSKRKYEDIFANVKAFEEKVKAALDDIINNNTDEARIKLNCIIVEYISDIQNQQLQDMSNIDGLKQVVFSMSATFVDGLDGMIGRFFQACWDVICDNQSSFIKGRTISEKIMLAQEIIHQIKKSKKGNNVVIKLDMVKAYDRVKTWIFPVYERSQAGRSFITGSFHSWCRGFIQVDE